MSMPATEGRRRGAWLLLQLLMGVIVMTGVMWDAQYHATVGHEGFFTPAHQTMYTGLGLGLLLGWGSIAATTWRYRRGAPGLDDAGTARLPWGLRAPPGHAALAVGLLAGVPAGPLDHWWHSQHGLDAVLWAPFHLMPIPGIYLAFLGVIYAAFAEANRRAAAGRSPAAARLLGLAAIALLLGAMLMLAAPAALHPVIFLPGERPLLAWVPVVAVLVPAVLLAAARAVPRPGAVTIVALVVAAWRWVMTGLVPGLVALEVYARDARVLARAPQQVVELAALPTLLIPALAVDGLAALAVRRGWTPRQWVPWAGALAAALVCLGERPWAPFVSAAASGAPLALLLAVLPLGLGLGALAGLAGARAGDALREAGR